MIGLRSGETMIRSLKVVNKDFIEKIKDGLVALENHLQGEFGQGINFNYLAYEKTGLIYQLRFYNNDQAQDEDDPDFKMELWCVKDNRKEQKMMIKCHFACQNSFSIS